MTEACSDPLSPSRRTDRCRKHWRRSFAVLAALSLVSAPLSAQAPGPLAGQAQPVVLRIVIEQVKAGSETRYDALAREVAALCRRLECPSAYLALESFTEPKEVYWLTAYRSQDDVARIEAEYASNGALAAELQRTAAAKAPLLEASTEALAVYRPELSDAAPWLVGTLPFALVVEGSMAQGSGGIFELPNGRQVAFVPVANVEDAHAIAAAFGPAAKRFAVRAEWSKPASAWIIGNPALWPPVLRAN
jgi:hypothetical protein